MQKVADLAKRLSQASVNRYSNPYAEFDWPEILTDRDWCFSKELLSIARLPIIETLDDNQLKKLAFFECVNFFSLNIHGEKALLQGVAARLYREWPSDISDYLHHFLDEENKHMSLFGGFCTRYAGKIYPDKKLIMPREYASGEEDFLFFAKIIIFEEIVDYYNTTMAADEQIHPFARDINRYHHADETRHLAFGREIVSDLWNQNREAWGTQKSDRLVSELRNYWQATWKEYFNPSVYSDAGIESGFTLYQQAVASSEQRLIEVSRRMLTFFSENTIHLIEEN